MARIDLLTHTHTGTVDIGRTYDELIESNGRLRDLVTILDVSQKDSSLRGTYSLSIHSLTHLISSFSHQASADSSMPVNICFLFRTVIFIHRQMVSAGMVVPQG